MTDGPGYHRRRAMCEGASGGSAPSRSASAEREPPAPASISRVIKKRRAARNKGRSPRVRTGCWSSAAIKARFDAKGRC
jgi:hypothetical protein